MEHVKCIFLVIALLHNKLEVDQFFEPHDLHCSLFILLLDHACNVSARHKHQVFKI
jgi:hypothetical protein